MAENRRNIKLTSLDDLFSTEESRAEAEKEHVQEIPITEIDGFPEHPFHVDMDDAMREMVESGKISGCAAAVYRRGECLFREFVGYGDAKKTMPLGKDSAFRLASMTKPVTAAAARDCCLRWTTTRNSPKCCAAAQRAAAKF